MSVLRFSNESPFLFGGFIEDLYLIFPAPFVRKAERLGVGLQNKETLFNNPTPNLSALRRGEELEEKLN